VQQTSGDFGAHLFGGDMGIFGKILQCIQFVPAAVHSVEVLFGHKSGQEKKEAALTLVGEAVGIGGALSEQPIADELKFKNGLGKIIDGVVECLNASVWAKRP
jgi:hypothetical protein